MNKDTPADIHFSTTLTIDIAAVNYGGHLGHDRLISLMHEARLRFLKTIGQSEAHFYGVGLIAKSLQVDYLKEVFWGESLQFHLSVIEPSTAGFSLFYHILDSDNQAVAKASITLLCFDYQKRKITRLAKEFMVDVNNLIEHHPS